VTACLAACFAYPPVCHRRWRCAGGTSRPTALPGAGGRAAAETGRWDDQLSYLLRRCMVQLTVLGYILVPIFTTPHWYVVILYALLMAGVGAWEASSRPAYRFKVRLKVRSHKPKSSDFVQPFSN